MNKCEARLLGTLEYITQKWSLKRFDDIKKGVVPFFQPKSDRARHFICILGP